MKNNQDIGSALKSKLGDLHDSPDDFVWDAIEEKLKKKKRRLLFWYFSFGLGILLLALFIFNPFNSAVQVYENSIESKEQNTEIVEQKDVLKSSPSSNFKDSNSKEQTDSNLDTKNQLIKNNESSISNTITQNNESASTSTYSKNYSISTISSENQKLKNTQLKNKKTDKTSQTNGLVSQENKNPNTSTNKDNTDLKSVTITQAKEKRNLENINKESVSDSLLKIEGEVLEISEVKEDKEKQKEKSLKDKKKVKDSLPERLVRWSINPQLIQSNYGAFNAETSNNSTTNYGLLLGVRMTKNTFLRVGVRQLDLKQTVNNITNNVSYLEIPLEVKYFFRDKKFNPYLTGGISYFIIDSSDSESPISPEYGDNFSLNFGLGLEHKLFDRFYINLESNLNYQIEPITSNIDYTPYIFSISTGIDYRF